MLVFSEKEFAVMVDELLYREPISFTMLCNIAERVLRCKVEYWCRTDEFLRGREFEDELMQEIHMRLIKTTVPYFLLRKGRETVNADPAGFEKWIITVARNVKKDFLNKVRNEVFNTGKVDELMELIEDNDPDMPEYTDSVEIERLKEAFAIVVSADVNIYKILTWIAQFVFVIDYDISKIQSNDKIVREFGEKTLFEMYDMILKMSEKIEWIEISPSQKEKILKELKAPWKDGKVYGDVRYREFFMKVNGEQSGKKSISDWVNRMNNMIRKKCHKNNKKTGRDKDETSYC